MKILGESKNITKVYYESWLGEEVGINTLPGYRGRGHGVIACSKAVENILTNDKIPQ